MQIDVGFGDVVYPDVVVTEYPTLLDFPSPTLHSYPPETVIAEKVEAMLNLGELNSRMKDFFDVWRLSRLQTTMLGSCVMQSGRHSKTVRPMS